LNTDRITQERLKELLHYDPDSGSFTWLVDRGLNCNKGLEAGTKNRLYKNIKVDSRQYPAHRLAWLYCFGQYPSDFLDHIDGDPTNNRISNLREVSRLENNTNKGRYSRGSSGYKGVSYAKLQRKWKAQIQAKGEKIYLGLFNCPREAAHAYNVAAVQLHGEFARLNPI
jgi:hypothetical protein